MEHKVLFRVFALILGFLGSIFLLNEPVRLRLKKERGEYEIQENRLFHVFSILSYSFLRKKGNFQKHEEERHS